MIYLQGHRKIKQPALIVDRRRMYIVVDIILEPGLEENDEEKNAEEEYSNKQKIILTICIRTYMYICKVFYFIYNVVLYVIHNYIANMYCIINYNHLC